MRRTYLDWASAAPTNPKALRVFMKAAPSFGNPSAPHKEGRDAKGILETARMQIARMAEVKSDAIIFTSGATESNALAIQGVVRASTLQNPHVLYLPTAHASTVKTMEELTTRGVHAEALVLKDGVIDLEKLKTQVRPETLLVSMDAVCGETGVRYDTRAVRRVLPDSVVLHIDASQLPLVESFAPERLKADLLTLDAQKIGGIRGVGLLIAPRSVPIAPLVYGGGQERGLRSGSEATALIAGFAQALTECAKEREAFARRAHDMRGLLHKGILKIADSVLNEGKEHVPHIVNVSLLGRDTDYLIALLDAKGYAVSTKSACETESKGSRVVETLTGDPLRAQATLRISFGPTTTKGDIERFLKILTTEVAFLDTRGH